MAGRRQGLAQSTDDQTPDHTRLAEAHLGLRRMDIDVDDRGRDFQEQRHQRVAVAGQEIRIGPAQRSEEQAILHRPVIDEEVLHLRIAAVERRQAGISRKTESLALGIDRQRICGELLPHDAAEPPEPGIEQVALRGFQLKAGPRPVDEREGNIGSRHGEAGDRIKDLRRFCPVRPQEFEPRRCRIKKIAKLDPGPRRMGNGDRLADRTPFHGQSPSTIGGRGPAGNRQTADGADRRQRLAPKAEGSDVIEIVVGKFRGRVTLDRESELVRRHAAAFIDDGDQGFAAILDGDLDPAGARVESVLDQLLHGRGRALDYLAGGDPVDQGFREPTDRHGGVSAAAANRARARILPSSTAG